MQKYIQIKSIFLLIVFSIITIHNTLPHIHHSHDNSEGVASIENIHHSHDESHDHHPKDQENSDEESENFLLGLLLNSHSHNSEVSEDSEILLNLNKIIIGKNLPVITLTTNQQVPKIPTLSFKKKYFEYQQDYKQEHQLLNFPLRAPPTLG